ncbi:MAG: ProQ/FinO family protein [Gammaproteobacteria bacterium]|nr:ProQ/FinO family protein [Gammaproteobacteria bacterium]
MKNNDSVTLNSFQALEGLKKSLEAEKFAPKKPKGRFKQINEIIQQLEAQYPQVFNSEKPLPLAIGIQKQIRSLHPQFSSALLGAALFIWTGRKNYLEAVIAGKKRHNLDGTVAAAITKAEKEYSKGKLPA